MKCSTYANLINRSSAVAHFSPHRLFIECGAILRNGWGASCPRLARRMSCWNPSEPAAARGLPPLTALTAAGKCNKPRWVFSFIFFFLSSFKRKFFQKQRRFSEAKRRNAAQLPESGEVIHDMFLCESLPVQMAWVYIWWVWGSPQATVTLSEKLENKVRPREL